MLVYQRVASNQSRTAGFGPGDTFDKRFKLQVWEIAFWEPGWEPGLWLMWLRHGPKYQVEVIQKPIYGMIAQFLIIKLSIRLTIKLAGKWF